MEDTEHIKKSDLPKLKSEKQKLFVKYYCQLQNATRAAMRAGYEPSNARHYGSELKRDPNISQHIKYFFQEKHRKLDIEAEEILSELKSIALSRITDFIDGTSEEELEALDPEDYESIEEYERDLAVRSSKMMLKPIHAMGDSVAALDEVSINPKTGSIMDIRTKGKIKSS